MEGESTKSKQVKIMFYGLNTRLRSFWVFIQRRMVRSYGCWEKVVIYHIFRQYTFYLF